MKSIPAILGRVRSPRRSNGVGSVLRVRVTACMAEVRWPDGQITWERFEDIDPDDNASG